MSRSKHCHNQHLLFTVTFHFNCDSHDSFSLFMGHFFPHILNLVGIYVHTGQHFFPKLKLIFSPAYEAD